MSKPHRLIVANDESGIALVLSMFLMLAMSVVAASMMFLSQTETYSTMNYRMMSQSRYGAESGIQRAANYLLYSYAAPASVGTDLLSLYNYTTSPVTLIANGNPVVLSYDATKSNYGSVTTKNAFALQVGGTLSLGTSNIQKVAYQPTATLMSMELIPAATNSHGVDEVIQTWQVVSDGSISGGSRNALVEVSAVLETQKESTLGSAVNYAAFATAATCGAMQLSGNGATKSYDSSALDASHNPVITPDHGNVGTNGNLTESGNATVNGTLSTPRVGVGNCSAGNVDAETTSGHANVTGGLVHLPSAISLPDPNVPTPALGTPASGTLSIGGGTTCASIVAYVPAANCGGTAGNLTFTPTTGTLVLPNISMSGGNLTLASGVTPYTYTMGTLSVSGGSLAMGNGSTTNADITVQATSISASSHVAVYMSKGNYNTNSISLSGGSTLTVDDSSGPSTLPNVTMNVIQSVSLSGSSTLQLGSTSTIANTPTVALNLVNTPSVGTPLDLSGGSAANQSWDASKFMVQYAGTGTIKLSGGTNESGVVYAPHAAIEISGNGDYYGEIVGSTIVDTGNGNIIYDRNLATKSLFAQTTWYAGNTSLSSFSWSRY